MPDSFSFLLKIGEPKLKRQEALDALMACHPDGTSRAAAVWNAVKAFPRYVHQRERIRELEKALKRFIEARDRLAAIDAEREAAVEWARNVDHGARAALDGEGTVSPALSAIVR